MLRGEAEMKARIEEEYRAKAEAEARAKIAAEMAAEKAEVDALSNSKRSPSFSRSDTGRSNGGEANGVGGAGAGGGSRGLRIPSPGGSSDGTEVNSLSARSSEGGGGGVDNNSGPPFSGGRMLDVAEAEEMNAAIKQLYLKTPAGAAPFVLFKARLRTSRREWNIERRYSDFVWLHEVGVFFFFFSYFSC